MPPSYSIPAPGIPTMGFPIIPPGIWLEARVPPLPEARPALFLDRDGTIIEDTHFISDPEQVQLIDGMAELIRSANQAAIPVCVVTNQSGIDRGLYDWAVFAAVQSRIENLLAINGAAIDGLAACPFHPDFTPDHTEQHANWRKPNPGLITALADLMNLDLAASWLVGDQPRDVEAADAAGINGTILLGTHTTPLKALARLRGQLLPGD